MSAAPVTTRRRYLKLALAISLGLNLLFIGIFAGAAFRHGGKHGAIGPQLHSYAAPYMRALPRDQRRALFEQVRSEPAIADRQTRRAFYQRMLAGLRADPFEAAAVQAVLQDQARAVQGLRGASQAVWLDLVSKMSGPERQSYADALEEQLKHKPRKRHRKKDRD